MINTKETLFENKTKLILGLDEAGRGNLAGPLMVGGCILDPKTYNVLAPYLNDSKKLSAKQRETAYKLITEQAIWYEVLYVSVATVEQLGPKSASKQAMQQIIDHATQQGILFDEIWVDAENPMNNSGKPLAAIVHGDALSYNIAAASILAKVCKDKQMQDFASQHPDYETLYHFTSNQGYGTAQHLQALKSYGYIGNWHRKNYAPVKTMTLVYGTVPIIQDHVYLQKSVQKQKNWESCLD